MCNWWKYLENNFYTRITKLYDKMNNSVNSTELDIVIREVKHEFRKMLQKRKELVVKLGNAIEKVLGDPGSICEEIKIVLREEIAQKLISARDVERYCPDKWKKRLNQRSQRTTRRRCLLVRRNNIRKL
jgi:hypothetical protein